jgi:hypothetical protein
MSGKIIFRKRELDTFWRFVYERQSIWHRRFILKLPQAEWTQDFVLSRNKFTNIYRELDPGTQFSINEIMSIDPYSDPRYEKWADGPDLRPDKVFNVMLYRLMCSIPTYGGWGFRRIEDFDWQDFEEYLGAIYRTGEPVFGNAYLISPYSSMGAPLKYQNVARLFGNVASNFRQNRFFERLDTAPSFQAAYGVIAKQYGFGPFLAYQVMVDLTYPLPNTKYGSALIPWNQDDWARLGPGAKRGFGRLSPSYNQLAGLKWLRDNQRREFTRIGVDFPFLTISRKDGTVEEVELTLANLQNCCCEFHKYRSIQDGVGKAQRIYTPSIVGSETGRFKWDVYTGQYR